MCDKAERRLAARTDGHVKRKRNTNMGLGVHQGKERRRNARGCANAAKVRVRHPPAPPIPGWTHPGSTSEGCEAPSREDGAKRTRNGEAHNAPQAWSGPQRHGVSLPPRGMTPTLPLHHLLGRAALWRTENWYFTGALRGPILWGQKKAPAKAPRPEPKEIGLLYYTTNKPRNQIKGGRTNGHEQRDVHK